MRESFRAGQNPVALLVLLLAVPAATAQVPLALPAVPIGSAGVVIAIARQSDGGLILGGYFTRIDGVPRRNLARLNADGTLDMNWNPSLDDSVEAIVIDAHDDVIVAGAFDHAGGLPRESLAKIAGHGSGVVDAAWNPGAVLHSAELNMLTIGPGGEVFVAGDIVDDQNVSHRIAKIAGDGHVDLGWNPPIDNFVSAIAADPFGALYVGLYGWGTRCCLLKLKTSGRGDAVPGWQATYDGITGMMAIGDDGSLYLAGMIRFLPTSRGEIDPTWHPDITQGITAFAIDGDALYMALDVAIPNVDARIVKLPTATGAPAQWQVPGRGVRVLATGADHSLYVGGMFEGPGGVPPRLQPKLSLARLAAADGTALATVDATLPGVVTAIALQPDGGTIVGGVFSRAGTTPRRNLLRLTADGRLDPDWNAEFDEGVLAIAVDARNAVFVGGYDNYPTSQQPVPVLQKFAGSGNGALDPEWNPSTDGYVAALATDAQGSLYVGGEFTSMSGVPRQNVAKLSTTGNGMADPTWIATADDVVNAIVVDDAHRALYVAGGHITHAIPGIGFGDVYEGAIAKVSADSGSTAGGWSRALVGVPYALALAPDGSLYAGGYFLDDAYNMVSDTLKLATDGAPDATWSAATSGSTESRMAYALVVDAKGDVYSGGFDQTRDDSGRALGPYLLKRSGTTGAAVADWAPTVDSTAITAAIRAMALTPAAAIEFGGEFSIVGAEPRDSLAALATTPPEQPTRGHSQHAQPGLVPQPPVPSPGRLRPTTPAR